MPVLVEAAKLPRWCSLCAIFGRISKNIYSGPPNIAISPCKGPIYRILFFIFLLKRLKVVDAENQSPSICGEIPEYSWGLKDFCGCKTAFLENNAIIYLFSVKDFSAIY